MNLINEFIIDNLIIFITGLFSGLIGLSIIINHQYKQLKLLILYHDEKAKEIIRNKAIEYAKLLFKVDNINLLTRKEQEQIVELAKKEYEEESKKLK
jgi:hypothetical protein